MIYPTPQQPILVISSPSGGGKSTLRRNLLQEKGSNREFLVSYTTRMPRADEVDGVDYHFLALRHINPQNMLDPRARARAMELATQEFDRMVSEGDILFEDTNFYGNRYGTPRAQLEAGLKAGKQMIADVNLDGLEDFKKAFGKNVRSIFLEPPSLEALAQRLQTRVDESIAALKKQGGATPESDAMQGEHPAADDAFAQLRSELMKQNAARIEQATTTLREAPAYDYRISSAGTPLETFEAVKLVIDRPLSVVARGDVFHLPSAPPTRSVA